MTKLRPHLHSLFLPSRSLPKQHPPTTTNNLVLLFFFFPFASPPFPFLSLLDNPLGFLVRWSVDVSRPFSPFYGVISPHSSTSQTPLLRVPSSLSLNLRLILRPVFFFPPRKSIPSPRLLLVVGLLVSLFPYILVVIV